MSVWSSWFGLAPNSLTQSILPDWSFMTVNETNSSAPGTEQRILAQDSYGRQIGRMMDVLEVLVAREPALKDNDAVKAFEDLRIRVDAAKKDAEKARQGRLIEDLLALKRKDEAQFKAVIQAVSL